MTTTGYYNDMFSTPIMCENFSDASLIKSWIKTEIALAKAQASIGIIPEGVDNRLQEIAKIENFDLAAMKDDFKKTGFPILPFVKQLTKLCDSDTARWVHYGATTQDILDTGMVLQIRDGLLIIENDLEGIVRALFSLTTKYRSSVMPGRTFQQLAAPITFGFKAAIWLDEILRHIDRLKEIKKRLLVGQCSGAVGTFATLNDKGVNIQKLMMKELGLMSPDITWHTARDRWSELVSFFALLTSTLAKIANEIAILMRSEIGELSEPFEPGRGASTTLPQKRNPISCEPILAIAHRMRELSGSQISAMIQEHERGVGQMHIEWMVIPEAFKLLSGSLSHSRFILENLQVDVKRMRNNLDIDGGLIMSEAVMMGLAPKLGKSRAHHLIYDAAGVAMNGGFSLRDAIIRDSEIMNQINEKELDRLLDPVNYLGSTDQMIDTILFKAEKYKN
ncbi:MAG: adenylosuccinate lyase family protein [Bacteroidales bacterium]